MLSAERLMLLGGLAAFVITVQCVRRRELREKYAVGWVLLSLALLAVGLFPSSIMLLADAARLSYSSLVLFLALGAIYLFSMSVSVSLTRQRRTSVRLLQDLALVEQELADMRADLAQLRNEAPPLEQAAPPAMPNVGSAPSA